MHDCIVQCSAGKDVAKDITVQCNVVLYIVVQCCVVQQMSSPVFICSMYVLQKKAASVNPFCTVLICYCYCFMYSGAASCLSCVHLVSLVVCVQHNMTPLASLCLSAEMDMNAQTVASGNEEEGGARTGGSSVKKQLSPPKFGFSIIVTR